MEERGSREGSQEKPPPLAFRGCWARETPAPRPLWRRAVPKLVASSPCHFSLCFRVCPGGEGGGLGRVDVEYVAEFIFPFFSDSGWGSRSRGKRFLPTFPLWAGATFSQFLGRGLPQPSFLCCLCLAGSHAPLSEASAFRNRESSEPDPNRPPPFLFLPTPIPFFLFFYFLCVSFYWHPLFFI